MFIFRLPKVYFYLDFGSAGSGGSINGAEDSDYDISYIAIEEDQIIGALVITRHAGIINSRGTIVRPYRRRMGVAGELWLAMIEHEKPKKVLVSTVSNRGQSLVESMREQYPEIEWRVTPSLGIRSLRKPKKRKKLRRRKKR